jgi:hypothetical protein
VAIFAGAHYIASRPGEEPWVFTDGVSIWGTELVRALLILITVWFFVLAHRRHIHHREDLWDKYFKPEENSTESLFPAGKETKGARSRGINSWQPPVTGSKTGSERIDATGLYRGFTWRGRTWNRFLRVIPLAGLYFLMLAAITFFVADPPLKLCVRGHESRGFDNVAFIVTIVCPLVAFFYALDAARLTSKMLECLGDKRTNWPPWLTNKRSREKRVRSEDIDGLLDVEVAVAKTRETAQFMYFAFLVLVLHVVSRSRTFENWTWPSDVCVIFFLNFLLACFCWWMVRRSASKLRSQAVSRLREARLEIESDGGPIDCFSSRGTVSYTNGAYRRRLKDLIKEIESERKGAFAHWIQDPALIALFVPTSLIGILTVLLQYWVTQH